MSPVEKPILVIDGHAATRGSIARVLVEEGFHVVAVADGSGVLRALETHPFALAVVASEPEAGLEPAATLERARQRQPWLRCLFVTPEPELALRRLRRADDVIAQPFRGRELVGCVFELLHRGESAAGRQR